MSGRDHAEKCPTCGVWFGGLDGTPCACFGPTGRERRKEGRRSMRKLRMALGLCVKCGGSRPTWATKCEACAAAPKPAPLPQFNLSPLYPITVPAATALPATDGVWRIVHPGLADELRVLFDDNGADYQATSEHPPRVGFYGTLKGRPLNSHPPEHPPMEPERTANRFKVGDRVRIVSSLGTAGSRRHVGSSATIAVSVGGGLPFYSLKIDGVDTGYAWLDCELVATAPSCFWLVWREPSTLAMYDRCEPTRRQESYALADAEAKRLAAKHPGARFHVLRSVEHVEVVAPAPAVTVHAEPEGIPEGPQG